MSDQEPPKDPKRSFTQSEKATLLIASEGKCILTGEPLEPNWHADHIQPHSKGGATTLSNGQATNAKANMTKSDSYIPLRVWQQDCADSYRRINPRDFLMVAVPGTGKTRATLNLVSGLLKDGTINKFLVVAPTDHLKRQWSDEAHDDFELDLLVNFNANSGVLLEGFHGVCTTYQQIAMGAGYLLFQLLISKHKMAVICDEIHHAGDNLSWGAALKAACEAAPRRLLLSGTPFRSDNNVIPFVRYEDDGNGQLVCKPDCACSYEDALRDRVIRRVTFTTFEGKVEFYDRSQEKQTVTFADDINEQDSRDRLRFSLSAEKAWLKDVLIQANARLTEIRNEDMPDAGGLVICMNIVHARAIAELLRAICSEEPIVATSEDPEASDKITTFARSSARWIVAVKMISEGVDIKRLRVGVYATNILTELFFRQCVGRVVRYQGGADLYSDFFLPSDPELVGFAERLTKVQQHVIEEEVEKAERAAAERSEASSRPILLSADDARINSTIQDGDSFTAAELEAVTARAKALGAPPVMYLRVLRDAAMSMPQPPFEAPNGKRGPSKDRYKEALITEVSTLAQHLAFVRGVHFREVHGEWLRLAGHPAKELSEYEAKRDWLLRAIAAAKK